VLLNFKILKKSLQITTLEEYFGIDVLMKVIDLEF
jgi:hypothetical protein